MYYLQAESFFLHVEKNCLSLKNLRQTFMMRKENRMKKRVKYLQNSPAPHKQIRSKPISGSYRERWFSFHTRVNKSLAADPLSRLLRGRNHWLTGAAAKDPLAVSRRTSESHTAFPEYIIIVIFVEIARILLFRVTNIIA